MHFNVILLYSYHESKEERLQLRENKQHNKDKEMYASKNALQEMESPQKLLPDLNVLDDIIEEDEETGKAMLTPKSTQEGEPKLEFSIPGTKKGSAAFCPSKARGTEKRKRKTSSRPWNLFETMESTKSGKQTSRTSISGSVKGDAKEEEDIDQKIDTLAKELEKLTHTERGTALPNHITARKYFYAIYNKARAQGEPKLKIENDELHNRAQKFLKKYKSKIVRTPRSNTAAEKSMDTFAEYLKTKYSNPDQNMEKEAKIELGNHKSVQYGYLMAQFKNPEAFLKAENEKKDSANNSKSHHTISKKSSQTSFSEATNSHSKANASKIGIRPGVPVRPLASADKIAMKVAVQNEKEVGDSHHIEVMVLCNKIHKLETEVGDKNKIIEALGGEIQTLRKENEALKKENEKLKQDLLKNGLSQ